MIATEPIFLSAHSADDDVEPDVPDVDDFYPPRDDDTDGGDGDDSRDPSRWITVATFWQPTEAHMARLKLESEEIDCVLIDENLVAMDWLYANAVGGIKLRVPEEDAVRARRLLAERPPQMALCADEPPAGLTDEAYRSCPECHSPDLDRPFLHHRNLWALCVMMLLATTVLFIALPILLVVYFIWLRPFRCRACGHTWSASAGQRGFEPQISD